MPLEIEKRPLNTDFDYLMQVYRENVSKADALFGEICGRQAVLTKSNGCGNGTCNHKCADNSLAHFCMVLRGIFLCSQEYKKLGADFDDVADSASALVKTAKKAEKVACGLIVKYGPISLKRRMTMNIFRPDYAPPFLQDNLDPNANYQRNRIMAGKQKYLFFFKIMED